RRTNATLRRSPPHAMRERPFEARVRRLTPALVLTVLAACAGPPGPPPGLLDVWAHQARGEPPDPTLLDAEAAIVRREAARALSATDPGAASEALLARVEDDPDQGVRRAAGFALGLADRTALDPRVETRLLAVLASDPDPGLRLVLVQALGRIGTAESVAPLTDHLQDPEPAVRCAAALALGQLAGDALRGRPPAPGVAAAELGAIRTALERVHADDPEPEVVWRAVWSLAHLGAPEARAVLTAAVARPPRGAERFAVV